MISVAKRAVSAHMVLRCFLLQFQLGRNSHDKVLKSSNFGQCNLHRRLCLEGNCTNSAKIIGSERVKQFLKSYAKKAEVIWTASDLTFQFSS